MHHFGVARVNKLDDLGAKSENPTHRELLDWLSPLRGFVFDRLVDRGLTTPAGAVSALRA
jgi:hypothetical protein